MTDVNPFLTKMLPVSVSIPTGNKLEHHPPADLTTDASLLQGIRAPPLHSP